MKTENAGEALVPEDQEPIDPAVAAMPVKKMTWREEQDALRELLEELSGARGYKIAPPSDDDDED